MIRALGLAIGLLVVPGLACADASLSRLYDLLAIDAYIGIARAEGMADADNVSQDMLGRPADPGFVDQMSRIYDVARMGATVREHLEGLSEEEVEASIAFFQTDAAVAITELEVAARRAMMDEDVEKSARRAWLEAGVARPEVVARIEAISQANDLVERNVAGALNSNLRYFQGLADGGGMDLTEDEILNLVWGQEEDIRIETESWLGGYFLLAYDSLDAGDLDGYLAFWNTSAGQALNAVIFSGFNEIYDEVSYATGRVVALNMMTQEL